MEQVIKAKLKAGKYRVCIKLDYEFALYLIGSNNIMIAH